MKRRNPCEGCTYWKKLSTSGFSRYACHFLLETGKRRIKDREGRCTEKEQEISYKGSNKG